MATAAASGLHATGFFGFRAPALPMSTLVEWAGGLKAPGASDDDLREALQHDRSTLGERITEIGRRAEVRSALCVASPDLLDAMQHRPADPRVQAALVRYVTRMASRPTPYGLFAGCGVGVLAHQTSLSVAHRPNGGGTAGSTPTTSTHWSGRVRSPCAIASSSARTTACI